MKEENNYAAKMLKASHELELLSSSRHYHIVHIKKHSHSFDFVEVEERLTSLKSLNISSYKEYKDMIAAWSELKKPFDKKALTLTKEVADFEHTIKEYGDLVISTMNNHFNHLDSLLLLERKFLRSENKATFELYLSKLDEYKNSIKDLKKLVGSFICPSFYGLQAHITQEVNYVPAARRRIESIVKHHFNEFSKEKGNALNYLQVFFLAVEKFALKEKRKIGYLSHK